MQSTYNVIDGHCAKDNGRSLIHGVDEVKEFRQRVSKCGIGRK
jgi:hypothetical protein